MVFDAGEQATVVILGDGFAARLDEFGAGRVVVVGVDRVGAGVCVNRQLEGLEAVVGIVGLPPYAAKNVRLGGYRGATGVGISACKELIRTSAVKGRVRDGVEDDVVRGASRW